MSSPSLKLHDDAWITSPLRQRGGELTVEFVDEKLINQCMACNTMFTVVVKKHHCVACGKVYCGKCSKVRAHSESGVLVRQRFCVICEEQCASRSIITYRNRQILLKQRNGSPLKQSLSAPVIGLEGTKPLQRRKSGTCSCSVHIQQPISATAILCAIKPKRKEKKPVQAPVTADGQSSFAISDNSTTDGQSSRSISPTERVCTMPEVISYQASDSGTSQAEESSAESPIVSPTVSPMDSQPNIDGEDSAPSSATVHSPSCKNNPKNKNVYNSGFGIDANAEEHDDNCAVRLDFDAAELDSIVHLAQSSDQSDSSNHTSTSSSVAVSSAVILVASLVVALLTAAMTAAVVIVALRAEERAHTRLLLCRAGIIHYCQPGISHWQSHVDAKDRPPGTGRGANEGDLWPLTGAWVTIVDYLTAPFTEEWGENQPTKVEWTIMDHSNGADRDDARHIGRVESLSGGLHSRATEPLVKQGGGVDSNVRKNQQRAKPPRKYDMYGVGVGSSGPDDPSRNTQAAPNEEGALSSADHSDVPRRNTRGDGMSSGLPGAVAYWGIIPSTDDRSPTDPRSQKLRSPTSSNAANVGPERQRTTGSTGNVALNVVFVQEDAPALQRVQGVLSRMVQPLREGVENVNDVYL